jgi:hypothetical protein
VKGRHRVIPVVAFFVGALNNGEDTMIIYGAGLSGCLAGALYRRAEIFESNSEVGHWGGHKAVLRFREDAIAHATGIPFKKVRVRKSIFFEGEEFIHVTPRLANMYSMKVSGKIAERSINSLDVSERYVAPVDLHERLGDMCRGRIHFEEPFNGVPKAHDGPIISTLPMPTLLDLLQLRVPELQFKHAPVAVERYKIQDCDVHQTVYFPGAETPAYRATLTGADLIIESTCPINSEQERSYITNSLFLSLAQAKFVSGSVQRYGKIVPLSDVVRKELLYKITTQHGIFSLGRFACWRNILLDDVYHDLRRIEQMASMNHYDLMRRIT